MPIVGIVVGWLIASWLGAVIGLIIGSVAWPVLWVGLVFVSLRCGLRRMRERVRKLSTDELLQIATDPTPPDLGLAIMELDRRGTEAPRPSLESLVTLLTSENSNQRGLGMGLLQAFYPSFKMQNGWSNMDSPEVWRQRIASFQA